MRIHAYAILLCLLAPTVSIALEPPDTRSPSSKSRSEAGAENALRRGNQLADPGLIAAFKSRLSGSKASGRLFANGLPAEGNPKVLIFLLEFEEYPHKAEDTAEVMRDKIFGAGSIPPYESLTAYYKRSSYGKLNIAGDVLGWYNAGQRSDIPETRKGRAELIKRVFESYSEHDFSQYDNNGDGKIDYFAVIWTGPRGEWASFWWGMKTEFYDSTFEADGKKLGTYSWMWAAKDWGNPQSNFTLTTLIHETGHALGLPDYYDYRPGIGPDGGIGGFGIMDAARFDHNCFSKFMLGWVEPEVVSIGDFKLRPASESPECMLLAPSGWTNNPFSEYFLVENRRKTGNDADDNFPGGGLVIWHVNAQLDSSSQRFMHDNSTTDYKLLKLLESDGLEEIETVDKYSFSQDDFYLDGRVFGPETKPASFFYGNRSTGISLVSHGGDYEAAFSLSATQDFWPKRGPAPFYSAGPDSSLPEGNIGKKIDLSIYAEPRF